jgi:hypothetical protein
MKPAVVFTLALLIAAFGLQAQDRPEGRRGPPPPPGEQDERPPGGRWGPQNFGPGMGGGGAATMIAADGYLFIFSNGTLYKVDPKEMKVVGELQVIKPRVRKPDGPPPEERDR